MGQRSGLNRSQPGVSQRSHKRFHISGSAAQEVGGDENEGFGGSAFSIQNMHEGVFSSFLNLLTSLSFKYGCKTRLPRILLSGFIALLSMSGLCSVVRRG